MGERIRDLRIRRGYGQAELATLAGIAANTLWRIENSDRTPRPPTLRKLAKLLGTTPAVLQGLPE